MKAMIKHEMNENMMLQKQCGEYEQTVVRMTTKIQGLETHATNLDHNLRTLRLSHEDLEREHTKLNDEHKHLTQDFRAFKSEHHDCPRIIKAALQENKRLSRELDRVLDQKGDLEYVY